MDKIYHYFKALKHGLFLSLFGYSAACQQSPSCSQYTLLQIKKNGTIIGLTQGLWRALHCK